MNKFKSLRQKMKISQWELAKKSGVPRWKIQLVEANFRSFDQKEEVKILEILYPKKINNQKGRINHEK